MRYSEEKFENIMRAVSGITAIEKEINQINEAIFKLENRFSDLKHFISNCEPLSNQEVEHYQGMMDVLLKGLTNEMNNSIKIRKYDVLDTYYKNMKNEQTDKNK